MTDQFQEFARALASAPSGAEGLKRGLVRKHVAVAPPELDEVTAQIRPLPRRMRLLMVVAVSLGVWAAIIAGVAYLLS
ncbi:hypothetical protein LJR225_002353 [Phenylobacterium sp. LjRoot225]|uniref:hypothetical protein n=1 Tax=Phenylobacterium sp. LjRoot225 TaxID=3342285 RepID=UPI003ECFBF92